MSAGASEDNDQDFEVNLAPIIDCFTVLITYLLVSASFISLSSLEVAVATASDTPSEMPAGEPPPTVYVELYESREMKVLLSGKRTDMKVLPPVSEKGGLEWDLTGLSATMEQLKKDEPALADVNVKAEPRLKYKYVVRAVETLRKQFPRVFVGE